MTWDGSHPPPAVTASGPARPLKEIAASVLAYFEGWPPDTSVVGNLTAAEIAALASTFQWMSMKLAVCGPLVNATLRFERDYQMPDHGGRRILAVVEAARDYRKVFNEEAAAIAASEKQNVEPQREDCNCDQSILLRALLAASLAFLTVPQHGRYREALELANRISKELAK